ncbi:YggS family pyridoxal phosphate-dependent enzyme [Phormidium sp. FACHB-1136]|uniref:YggS family pyridoxal phosphate-dependent enzyme n=1 Tax=Phormidium sp. FACHB-1136 TaxID=2692848 RepID=UPI001F549D28|nr:YggS family pyridoxal phosphate-dependent enzyme [Phormidium sp. FACHB-1136]
MAMASAQQITTRILELQATLPSTVTLVAVTKLLPTEVIRIAYAAGVRHFGESRVQEAIAKQTELQDCPDITWHLIGHLQTNKARKAVEHFQWIHSVDSLKLAERLNQVAAELGKRPHSCLQVKMVPDPPKAGFDLAELEAALPTLNQLTHLDLCGLMAIPPQNSRPAEIQQIFEDAKQLADRINQSNFSNLKIHQLSMGMSGDYPLALAAGTTLIRLGTTLFGPRPTP